MLNVLFFAALAAYLAATLLQFAAAALNGRPWNRGPGRSACWPSG